MKLLTTCMLSVAVAAVSASVFAMGSLAADAPAFGGHDGGKIELGNKDGGKSIELGGHDGGKAIELVGGHDGGKLELAKDGGKLDLLAGHDAGK